MIDPDHPIAKLMREDQRYKFEAYVFVFEALRYAQEELGMGEEVPAEAQEEEQGGEWSESESSGRAPRHLTGQQLCEAIRQYALDQYGYMAKCVLNQWGVRETGDFGEIVFNLIRIGEMRKTPDDRREDFDDVYDFEDGLVKQFQIETPE
jgi:uncharacterized repeat protein (TIGR04138 family)